MSDIHPDAARLYEELRRRGTAPPRPREYGLRVISELLRIERSVDRSAEGE